MENNAFRISVIALCDAIQRPVPASPRTRETVPPGYGRREQCRPFVAAAGAGLAIPSPFEWGYCLLDQVPQGTRSFRSPIPGGCARRVFYVRDEPGRHFRKNQFDIPESVARHAGSLVIPGLSFFEGPDQQHMVKLHLPYILRTQSGAGLLFLPPINRARTDGLMLLSGLVETSWYAGAVNLVFELPQIDSPVHVGAGETIAQVLPLPMKAAKADAIFPERHRREVRNALEEHAEWHAIHGEDRSAYKRLARKHAAE